MSLSRDRILKKGGILHRWNGKFYKRSWNSNALKFKMKELETDSPSSVLIYLVMQQNPKNFPFEMQFPLCLLITFRLKSLWKYLKKITAGWGSISPAVPARCFTNRPCAFKHYGNMLLLMLTLFHHTWQCLMFSYFTLLSIVMPLNYAVFKNQMVSVCLLLFKAEVLRL